MWVATDGLEVGQTLGKPMLILSKVVWNLVSSDFLGMRSSVAAVEPTDHRVPRGYLTPHIILFGVPVAS